MKKGQYGQHTLFKFSTKFSFKFLSLHHFCDMQLPYMQNSKQNAKHQKDMQENVPDTVYQQHIVSISVTCPIHMLLCHQC